MRADYHMHLVDDDHLGPCPYTLERVEAYVRAAEAAGVDVIGVSDHCHRFVQFRELFRPIFAGPRGGHPAVAWLADNLYEDLDRYVETLVLARQRGWPVKIGLEVDWFTYAGAAEAARETARLLAAYPFDYVLGSVHFLGDWPVDVSPDYGWPERDVEATYGQYFSALQDAAASGLFDVLAHPDLVKKFGHRVPDATAYYEATVEAAARANVVLEVSTAGLRYPAGELYPAPRMLQLAAERGVPVTFGSDAHRPEDVGRHFDRAEAAARRAGHRETVSFAARRRRPVPFTRDSTAADPPSSSPRRS